MTGARITSTPTEFDVVRAVNAVNQPLATAIQTGEAVPEYEARIEKPGSLGVDVTVSATPLFDEQGNSSKSGCEGRLAERCAPQLRLPQETQSPSQLRLI